MSTLVVHEFVKEENLKIFDEFEKIAKKNFAKAKEFLERKSINTYKFLQDIYSLCDREVRENILYYYLFDFDKRNYIGVQPMVANINNPWLIGDIIISRYVYNPGCGNCESVIKEYKSWNDKLESVFTSQKVNQFFMAYAICQKDVSSKKILNSLQKTFPNFFLQVIDVCAGFLYLDKENASKKNLSVEKCERNILKKYHKDIHQLIQNSLEKNNGSRFHKNRPPLMRRPKILLR